MKKQLSFSDVEYSQRKKKTKREIFLDTMEKVVPWDNWVEIIRPYYPDGKRGRRPQEIERKLRMYMLQIWFNLSDEGTEDAIYDSYAMKNFLGINFNFGEQVPDATTLGKFRNLLEKHNLQKQIFDELTKLLSQNGYMIHGGTIVDATIVNAPDSRKNAEKKPSPEMHSVKKNNKWFYGMRSHVGVDAVHGFVHSLVVTPANENEGKIMPQLIRVDDEVVYGDAGYLKSEKYVTDGIERDYRFNRQMGTFKRHYGDSISYQYEKELEQRKSSVRCKVEYVFHVVKDIFHWKKAKYRGLYKNTCHAQMLFASANLYMLATAKF